ncbi:YdcF family protein [Ideonella sp. A 288]|uniref:YdcF family protein n=1 Tax=Ideonella sp. A 288 TaxID=1962181 RepID=UPI001F3D70D0|nr:YdcF family protein [Ideonella sp. A 288]
MQLGRGRRIGWLPLLGSLLGLWMMSTLAVGNAAIDGLTRPPPPLDLRALQAAGKGSGTPKTAILVLGGGRRERSPEYGAADLTPFGIERLRYGLWVARQTGWPVAFSGGVGFAARPGPTEAAIARRVAERDFGMNLRWTEDRSRDTHENARFSLDLMREQGIERVVLVTHAFHMSRALQGFERAQLRTAGPAVQIVPAPVGVRGGDATLGLRDWLPSAEGFTRSWLAMHEWVGRLGGA